MMFLLLMEGKPSWTPQDSLQFVSLGWKEDTVAGDSNLHKL